MHARVKCSDSINTALHCAIRQILLRREEKSVQELVFQSR